MVEVAPQRTQSYKCMGLDGLDPTQKASPPIAPCGANNRQEYTFQGVGLENPTGSKSFESKACGN